MFNIFKKAEPNREKIEHFCSWFIANNDRIINSVENSANDKETMFRTLDEVEEQLAVIYRDGYKGEIQFEYGFNSNIGKWDLNLFHLNNKFLVSATALISDRINKELGDKWSANIAK